ncbi:MAG TPA: FAD-dependent oxidoreductase [Rhizomicrobium sp.]|nr:FAD-dependent oxidoreductase [Rhizomicrobium sp.]
MDLWDVIVVGAGAAGLAAARHAREQGASVLVVNKGLVGRTGATITSGGGVSVAGSTLIALGLEADPADTEEVFIRDMLKSGYYLNDQRLVESIVSGIGEELGYLIRRGVRPRISKRAPGHSSGRGVGIPGPDMQKAMTSAALDAGAQFREDFFSAGLLQNDGAVAGVAGLDRRTGEIEAIPARAVVIASGGTTSNWRLRTAPEELTGDGHAMALDAGAELIEMEMLQFLPCCLVAPEIWRGIQFPWTIGPQAGVRAWLLNKYGERFLARWDPERMELATRDVVSAASAAEVYEGRGSPNGGVYLSWAHLPRDILDNFPSWSKGYKDWRYQGFDMTPLVERIREGHAIEVAPAAHFSLGGIRVDVHGDTGVPGLYACGEATGGVHGGNRLSGNAGSQVLVQGRQAGLAAARAAQSNKAGAPAQNWDALKEQIEAPFQRERGVAPVEVKQRLTAIAENALGPVRTGKAMTAALEEVRDIRRNVLPRLASRNRDPRYNRDWSDALECAAGVPVLEAALISAIGRSGSIGAHQRRDIPGVKAPLEHSIVRRQNGELAWRAQPVEFPIFAPAA